MMLHTTALLKWLCAPATSALVWETVRRNREAVTVSLAQNRGCSILHHYIWSHCYAVHHWFWIPEGIVVRCLRVLLNPARAPGWSLLPLPRVSGRRGRWVALVWRMAVATKLAAVSWAPSRLSSSLPWHLSGWINRKVVIKFPFWKINTLWSASFVWAVDASMTMVVSFLFISATQVRNPPQ